MIRISVFLIGVLYFIFSAFSTIEADSKFVGKAEMALILSGIGVATKVLIHKEHKKLEKIRKELGSPDRIIRIERGFDVWTIEHYDKKKYVFKNGILQKRS